MRRWIRRVVREEIAKADADWDAKVSGELDILTQQGYDRMSPRLRAELDDPAAVAKWLSEGRA